MEVTYRALAFGVLALHAAFVAWVFAGGFLARRSRRLFRVHMASIAWGLFSVVTGFPCPFTQLENHFRARGGLISYADECIPHYVWIPLGLPQAPLAQVLIIAPAVALNYLAYRPRRTTGPVRKPGS